MSARPHDRGPHPDAPDRHERTRYDPERHGPRVLGPGFHDRVFAVVRTVPRGRVTTFGDVAAALGWRNAARRVGQALSRLPGHDSDVPWQRVVRASGQVACGEAQAARLRREGLAVTPNGVVREFARRRWYPPNAGSASARG